MNCKDRVEAWRDASSLQERNLRDAPRYAFVSKTYDQYFSTSSASLTRVAKDQVQHPMQSVTGIVSRYSQQTRKPHAHWEGPSFIPLGVDDGTGESASRIGRRLSMSSSSSSPSSSICLASWTTLSSPKEVQCSLLTLYFPVVWSQRTWLIPHPHWYQQYEELCNRQTESPQHVQTLRVIH
jgi:hypothetical protein